MIKGRTKKDIRLYHRELWFHDFFYRIGIKPKKAEIKKLVNFYWKSIQEKAKLMPHTKKVLVRLKKELKLIVISDSDGNKAIKLKRLRKLGVFGLFDLVITGDDVNTTKPDERFYTAAFKKLKVRPSECVMVGDKPEYDLKLAKKLGMKTVWFVYGDWAEHEKNKKFNYVDYKIKRLDELISIVTQQ